MLGVIFALFEGGDLDLNGEPSQTFEMSVVKALFNMMNNLASIVSWIVLYCFVFEVEDVRDRLEWTQSVS